MADRKAAAAGHKRANGEGTIYQRKDGRWEGAAFVLTTAGTYRRVRVYAPTHDDARKKLTKLIQQSDQGIPVVSASWTVAEYLNYWLSTVVLNERRPKTYQGYEGVVRLHLIRGIGRKRLAKLTAQDIRIFLTQIRQECQCCKHGWDSQRTNRAVARLGSAVAPGCRSAWSSSSTPCSATRWSRRCARRSSLATWPSWSKCQRRGTRSTGV